MAIVFSEKLIVKIDRNQYNNNKHSLIVNIKRDQKLIDKDLNIELIDEGDCFNIYKICINEGLFNKIKNEQGLLIDFESFPQKVIELLKMCQGEELKSNPKFILSLDLNPTNDQRTYDGHFSLKIIETNPFKHLTHLSLNLSLASDKDTNTYLSECLKKNYIAKENLETKLKRMEINLTNQLKESQEIYDNKLKEFEKLTNELHQIECSLSTKYNKELKDEKEKTSQVISKLQKKLENERANSDTKINHHLRDHKSRIERLDSENLGLKKRLNSSDVEKTKMMRDFDSRVQELETELEKCRRAYEKVRDKYEQSKSDKDRYADEFVKKKGDMDLIEASSQKLLQDMNKAHEIIKKLQHENKYLQMKVKEQNVVILKQEECLGQRETDLRDCQEKLLASSHSVDNLSKEVSDMRNISEMQYQEIEKMNSKIKLNETVITWLNKQIKGDSYPAPDPKGNIGTQSLNIDNLNLKQNPSSQKIVSIGLPFRITNPHALIPPSGAPDNKYTTNDKIVQLPPFYHNRMK